SLVYLFHFLYYLLHHRDLPSFPTRRSSDLPACFSSVNPCPSVGPLRNSSCWRSAVWRESGKGRFASSPDGTTAAPNGTARYANTDRKSTRLNSSHVASSYAVFCLKKKKQ